MQLNTLKIDMLKKFPLNPPHPERVCWGCERYCPSNSMACGNGSDRTQHPHELFGDGWESWGLDDRDSFHNLKKSEYK